MTALSLTIMSAELDRLAQVYPRPTYMPKDARGMASLYLEILAGTPPVTAEQLAAAVSAYRAGDERFFPKPGALKALARIQRVTVMASSEGDLEARYKAWEYTPDAVSGTTSCPVCQARWGDQLVGINPDGSGRYRWQCWHDHDVHMRVSVPYIGRDRSPREREALEARLDVEQRVVEAVAAGTLVIDKRGRAVPAATPAPTT